MFSIISTMFLGIGIGYALRNWSILQKTEKTISLTTKGKEFAKKVLKPVYEIENAVMKKVIEEFSENFILAYERYAQYFEEAYKKRNRTE